MHVVDADGGDLGQGHVGGGALLTSQLLDSRLVVCA